jgi:hypothetical protein
MGDFPRASSGYPLWKERQTFIHQKLKLVQSKLLMFSIICAEPPDKALRYFPLLVARVLFLA